MALRKAVKATLIEEEQPRSRFAEAAPIVDEPAPAARVTAQPLQKATARPASDAVLAAAWHQRAEALCAVAETLPSKNSWSLISKIAALYDEIARDAGWRPEEDAPPPAANLRGEAPPAADEPPLADERQPLAPPPPSEGIAFPRRSLPGRSLPRRRA
jgi:hypothetical protein